MNNFIKLIEDKYKPLKYTMRGRTLNFFSTLGNYVVKPRPVDKDISKLFSYLDSRNFNNFPKLKEVNDDYITYEYIDSKWQPPEQKMQDLALLVAKLHNKTAYFKEVTQDKYQEIYENIKNNITYLKEYYSNLYDKFFDEVYMSPSKYYFMINYTLINNDLAFVEQELDEWFNLVKDSTKQRVVLLHNNLSLDHYLKEKEPTLISWDKYTFDTPVLDIVTFYKNEYLTCNFESPLSLYMKNFTLSEDEQKLLFILISLPEKIEITENEFNNTCSFVNLIDYISRTEKLIRPYYAKEKKE